MEKSIKSHVYLAESILNRFSYKDKDNRNIIDYIDLNTMKLDSISTRKFNREIGYYTNRNELLLKINSEEKIGNIITKLEQYRKQQNIEFILNDKDKSILRKYLAYQWIRNDSIMKIFIKKLKLIIPESMLKNIIIEDEEKYQLFNGSTKDLDIVIFFNNTAKQYIINSATSTINSSSEDYYIVNMVLTPNILISFCKKGSIEKYLKLKTDCIVNLVSDEKNILDCNIHTMNVAVREEPHFVVGRKKELIETLDMYEEIKKIKN